MISHLTPCFIWWPLLDLNQRPSDYENYAQQRKNNSLRLKSCTYCDSDGLYLPSFTISTATLPPLVASGFSFAASSKWSGAKWA